MAMTSARPTVTSAAATAMIISAKTAPALASSGRKALKAIRLYAPEPWVRRIAQQALVHPDRGAPAVPDFLGANELDDAEISVMAARYIG